MATGTTNPPGSTDPRDLYANARNLDLLLTGPQPFYPDRLNAQRYSWRGMESDFSTAQSGRQIAFQQFLAASGFEAPVSYAAGVTLQRATQTFVRENIQYRIRNPSDLPYTLTGNWANESGKFSAMGDSGLRQEIVKGDFLQAEYVQVVGGEDQETRSLKSFLSKRKAVFLSDSLTDAQLQAARSEIPGDVTTQFAAAIAKTQALLPATLFIDEGTFLVNQSSLPNLAKTGFSMFGAGMQQTIIKLTASGRGLNFDAFENATSSTPFAQNIDLRGFTVEGNSSTTFIIDMQGIARSSFADLNVREARNSDGSGFSLRGVMLSKFSRVNCSTDLQAMTNKPRHGLHIDEGRRAGNSVGNSSNNVFEACYFEGLPIGIRCLLGDQNTFIGGSPESCTVYGLLVGPGSRYNTFMGTGFENVAATADIADGGISTAFINCYASKSVMMQGRGGRIQGGYYQRIEVQVGATGNYVGDVTLKHWDTAEVQTGGFVDDGVGTRYGNMYDSKNNVHMWPKKARTALTVGTSPYTFTNESGVPVEVLTSAGTITQVRKGDGTGDMWLVSAANPGSHILLVGDTLEISYSALPGISIRPLNAI